MGSESGVFLCRWPQKFELQVRAFRNSDRKSKTAVRSCGFPSPSLLKAADNSAPFNAETGTGTAVINTFLHYMSIAIEHYHLIYKHSMQTLCC